MTLVYPYINLTGPTDVHTDLLNWSLTLDGKKAVWGNHGSPMRIKMVSTEGGYSGGLPVVIADLALPTTYGSISRFGFGHDDLLYGLTDTGKIVKLSADGTVATLLSSTPGGSHISTARVLKTATNTFVVCYPGLGYTDWNYYDVVRAAWVSLDTATLTAPDFNASFTVGLFINQWCLDIDGDVWGVGGMPNGHVGYTADYFGIVKFTASTGAVAGHWRVPAVGFNLSGLDSMFHRKGDATDHFVIGWASSHTYAVSRADPTTVNIATTERSGVEATIAGLEPNSATYWVDGDQFIGPPRVFNSDTLELIETIDGTLWPTGNPDLGGGGAKYDWLNSAWVTMSQGAPAEISWHYPPYYIRNKGVVQLVEPYFE